jgi:hypothetical protein
MGAADGWLAAAAEPVVAAEAAEAAESAEHVARLWHRLKINEVVATINTWPLVLAAVVVAASARVRGRVACLQLVLPGPIVALARLAL